MAGILGSFNRAAISTGTDEKTMIQIIAPTNQRLLVKQISIGFDGTANDGTPIDIIIARQTTAGTMSSLTPTRISAGSETLQATGQHTAGAEPTKGDVLYQDHIHPQGGLQWQAPWGVEIVVPGGTRLGIIVHAAASVNANVTVIYEE